MISLRLHGKSKRADANMVKPIRTEHVCVVAPSQQVKEHFNVLHIYHSAKVATLT